MKMLFVFSSYS